MNRAVAGIWWAMLAATVFGVVPVVLGLLSRALAAARRIEAYSAEILQSGVGIANNTSKAAALKDTIAAAPRLVAGAHSIERHVATIRTALGGRVPSGRQEGESSSPGPADITTPESHKGEAHP